MWLKLHRGGFHHKLSVISNFNHTELKKHSPTDIMPHTLPHILLPLSRKCLYIGSFEIRNENLPIKFDGQFRATRIS